MWMMTGLMLEWCHQKRVPLMQVKKCNTYGSFQAHSNLEFWAFSGVQERRVWYGGDGKELNTTRRRLDRHLCHCCLHCNQMPWMHCTTIFNQILKISDAKRIYCAHFWHLLTSCTWVEGHCVNLCHLAFATTCFEWSCSAIRRVFWWISILMRSAYFWNLVFPSNVTIINKDNVSFHTQVHVWCFQIFNGRII